MRLSYSLVIANLLNLYSCTCTCPMGKRLLRKKIFLNLLSFAFPFFSFILFFPLFLSITVPLSKIYVHTNPKLIKFKCDYHILKTRRSSQLTHKAHSPLLHKYTHKLPDYFKIRYHQYIILALLFFLLVNYISLKLANSRESGSQHFLYS